MEKIVNENSTAYLTLTFKDKNGNLATPQTIIYNIHCLTNGQEIKGDTNVTPASSVEITITPNENRIIDPNNKYERRLVTVTATYNANDEVTAEYEYKVLNLRYIS